MYRLWRTQCTEGVRVCKGQTRAARLCRKGESARNGQRSPIWPTKKPSARTKQQFRPVIVGVNSAKDSIYRRLARTEPGPDICIFRMIGILAISRSSRQSVLWSSSPGAQVLGVELPDGKRNEALDCRVYACGALLPAPYRGKLNREVDAVATVLDGRAPPDEAPQLLLAADAGSVREVRGPSVKTMGACQGAGRCEPVGIAG